MLSKILKCLDRCFPYIRAPEHEHFLPLDLNEINLAHLLPHVEAVCFDSNGISFKHGTVLQDFQGSVLSICYFHLRDFGT